MTPGDEMDRPALSKDRLTWADYVDFPDDGQRYEIIDGVVEVTPVPRPDHQRISRCIDAHLRVWAASHAPAEVFHAPIGLILADDTILVPDLLVVLGPEGVTSRGVEVVPPLVVEILSPSTQHRDRGVKRHRYARAGVSEYWIIDGDARTIEQYVLDDAGRLELVAARPSRETVRSVALKGLIMPVEVAFRDLC